MKVIAVTDIDGEGVGLDGAQQVGDRVGGLVILCFLTGSQLHKCAHSVKSELSSVQLKLTHFPKCYIQSNVHKI